MKLDDFEQGQDLVRKFSPASSSLNLVRSKFALSIAQITVFFLAKHQHDDFVKMHKIFV